eukprot:scaffold5422_cov63-Phaeocystis_antarctica.AAC.8
MSFRRRKPKKGARETQWPPAWANSPSTVPTKDSDSSKLPVRVSGEYSPVRIRDTRGDTESGGANAVVLKGYKGVREGNI